MACLLQEQAVLYRGLSVLFPKLAETQQCCWSFCFQMARSTEAEKELPKMAGYICDCARLVMVAQYSCVGGIVIHTAMLHR